MCRCKRPIKDERYKTCEVCREQHRRWYRAKRDDRIRYQRAYADQYLNKHREVCPACRQVIQARLQRQQVEVAP